MAMTKAEKQLIEDLKTQCALRYTDAIKPDIPVPSSNEGIVNGYSFNAYSKRVTQSCSSVVFHNRDGWNIARSQNPIEQYSSVLLALKAMRNEIERRCADDLRSIDKLIEEASKKLA